MKYVWHVMIVKDRLGRWQFYKVPVGTWDCCGYARVWLEDVKRGDVK